MSAPDSPQGRRTPPIAQPVAPHVGNEPHGRVFVARTEDTMSSTGPAPAPDEPGSPGPTEPPATGWAARHDQVELTGPAVGTLAWGLVVLAVAGVLLVREVTDLTVDLSYALPLGMVALGLLLVVGAVLTGIRRR